MRFYSLADNYSLFRIVVRRLVRLAAQCVDKRNQSYAPDEHQHHDDDLAVDRQIRRDTERHAACTERRRDFKQQRNDRYAGLRQQQQQQGRHDHEAGDENDRIRTEHVDQCNSPFENMDDVISPGKIDQEQQRNGERSRTDSPADRTRGSADEHERTDENIRRFTELRYIIRHETRRSCRYRMEKRCEKLLVPTHPLVRIERFQQPNNERAGKQQDAERGRCNLCEKGKAEMGNLFRKEGLHFNQNRKPDGPENNQRHQDHLDEIIVVIWHHRRTRNIESRIRGRGYRHEHPVQQGFTE